MQKLEIHIGNLNFLVKLPNHDSKYKSIIEQMSIRLTTYSFRYDRHKRRNVRVMDKVYAAIIDTKLEYRFNINLLKSFMLLLGQHMVSREEIAIYKSTGCDADSLDLETPKGNVLRDYQLVYQDILLNRIKPFMLVDLMTGYGKTRLAVDTIIKINERTIVLVLPKYIDKWIGDVKDLSNVKDDEIYVVKGGDSLNNLIQLGIDNELKAKFIIVSIRTMINYVKEYENTLYDESFTYLCKPSEFTNIVKAGVILNDETHQEFHAVYKITLYLDACRFIGLSATLEDNDLNIRRMYNTMFPGDSRISNIVKYEPYVTSTIVRYSLNSMKGIRFKRPQGYNHILYEESIMRNKKLLKDYAKMIVYYTTIGYIDRRKEGDKLLIFVASVNLATILTEHLSMIYDTLDVRRYVEDDAYENIIEGDIIISTLLSAGTAFDIKGLITLINTVSVKSIKSVKQSFGRLRDIKGKEMQYYSLYCKNIPNQVNNANSNRELLRPLSKNWYVEEYSQTLHTY